jgi:hypothetical protein
MVGEGDGIKKFDRGKHQAEEETDLGRNFSWVLLDLTVPMPK